MIGYLVKYEAAQTFVPKNKEKAKTLREIYIKDLRYVNDPTIIGYSTLRLSPLQKNNQILFAKISSHPGIT